MQSLRQVPPFGLDIHLSAEDTLRTLTRDVLRGLTASPRMLPPKYFYDASGSALFEEITKLPEYYCSRAEKEILADHGQELMALVQPQEIVELGSGSLDKICMLLATEAAQECLLRYVPLDVDGGCISAGMDVLSRLYPGLHVHGVVGDFECHLPLLPTAVGRRLVVFLGSTIGNLDLAQRSSLLHQVRALMGAGDAFLLGIDLIKDRQELERAYDDPGGVTAAFNRNILNVVNGSLNADFQPQAFRHYAFFNSAQSRIEMHLVSDSSQRVEIRDLGLTLHLAPEESIWTESSYKFTRWSALGMLREAGLRVAAWNTDSQGRFALVLAVPS